MSPLLQLLRLLRLRTPQCASGGTARTAERAALVTSCAQSAISSRSSSRRLVVGHAQVFAYRLQQLTCCRVPFVHTFLELVVVVVVRFPLAAAPPKPTSCRPPEPFGPAWSLSVSHTSSEPHGAALPRPRPPRVAAMAAIRRCRPPAGGQKSMRRPTAARRRSLGRSRHRRSCDVQTSAAHPHAPTAPARAGQRCAGAGIGEQVSSTKRGIFPAFRATRCCESYDSPGNEVSVCLLSNNHADSTHMPCWEVARLHSINHFRNTVLTAIAYCSGYGSTEGIRPPHAGGTGHPLRPALVHRRARLPQVGRDRPRRAGGRLRGGHRLRRVLDRGLRAGFGIRHGCTSGSVDLPGAALGDRLRPPPLGADVLRHHHAGRLPVVGGPAARAAASAAEGQRPWLLLLCAPGDRILPAQARSRRRDAAHSGRQRRLFRPSRA